MFIGQGTIEMKTSSPTDEAWVRQSRRQPTGDLRSDARRTAPPPVPFGPVGATDLARAGAPRATESLDEARASSPGSDGSLDVADPSDGTWTPTSAWTMWAVVVLGVGLRFRELTHQRSLWRDEASLVFNLRHRGITGFTTPLGHDQGTPPGFFVLAQTVGRTLGGSEWAYRAVPFAASCGALVVAAVLACRHLRPVTGVAAMAVLAFSSTLLYYAAEVKQYPLDLFMALLVVLVADEAARRRWSATACTTLALVGSAAALTSYPSAFVLPAVGVASLVHAWPDRRATGRVVACGLAWVAVSSGAYLAWTRHLNDSDFLREFWAAGFVPLPPTSSPDLEVWGGALRTLYTQLLAPPILLLAVVLSLLGLRHLWRDRPSRVGVLLVPFVLVFGASSLEMYPAIERSILFLLPAVAMAIGAGCEQVGDLLRARTTAPVWLPAVIVGLLAALPAAERATDPPDQEELRPLFASLAGEPPADAVLVTTHAFVAWDYYASRFDLRPRHVVLAEHSRVRPASAPAAAAKVDGERLVWVVDTAFWRPLGRLDPGLVEALDRAGCRLDERHAAGASVYRYDLSRTCPAGT